MTRPQAHPSPLRIRFVDFELDESNACLQRNGESVAVAPTPFTLLCVLAGRPGALLTKDALLDAVWGHRFVSESVLKTAISDLRTALGDDAKHPRFIETVPRRGYRFIATPSPAPAAAPAAAMLPMAGTGLPPTFIGRTDAIVRLHRAWERACNGRRELVWVAGEPGIGKTTLMEQFVSSLGDVACARGHCIEHYGTGEPYLPVLEALADLCRKDPALPTMLRAVAPTWLLQLPWLSTESERDALRRELAGVGPERMLREMAELFDRYTAQRPLLLVTEDLHWSDRATIQLIDYLARRRGQARLMWLASFRVTEVVALDHPLSALRHELRLQRLCDEVVLDPFSETEVADYVAQRSPSLARDEAFVRALHERTDGVPLFVSSVMSEVMERAEDPASIEARLANVAVPENLAAIVDHYIARLGQDQRRLLSAAAVCGIEFRAETVSLAIERDLAAVAHTCEELVREQMWLTPVHPGEGVETAEAHYAFRHALFRQVLYDRIPASVRPHLHRQVGISLERERQAGMPIGAAALAMHFDRGSQPMAALGYYAEAAEAALRNFSPAACLGFAERASVLLRQAPAGPERDALELTLATLQGVAAFHTLGVGREARSAFERAYALLPDQPAHPIRGRLLHGLGYLLSLHGDYAKAQEVAERAEALASVSDDPALMVAACIVRSEVHHLQGRSPAARAWIARGLTYAQALDEAGDDAGKEIFVADPQVTLRGMLAIELVRCGLTRQARKQVEQALHRAGELKQPMTRLVATWQEALLEVRLDNAERVSILADQMQALVEDYALGPGGTAWRWFRGWADARKGAPLEGYRRIHEAYEEFARFGMRSGASEVLGYAAQALLLAGDTAAAQLRLNEAMQVARELDERVYLPQLLLLEGAIAQACGRSDAGNSFARRAVEEARAQEAPWLELLALVELCERHAAAADDYHALRTLVARLPEAVGTVLMERAARVLIGTSA